MTIFDIYWVWYAFSTTASITLFFAPGIARWVVRRQHMKAWKRSPTPREWFKVSDTSTRPKGE